MKKLPSNVSPYKKTPNFNEITVPKGLLKNHNTKQGTWALLTVQSGEIEYVIENEEVNILSPELSGVIEPEVKHHIKPLGAVSFFIEFYK
jgi:tellurite resistance-related uncharacterized protein